MFVLFLTITFLLGYSFVTFLAAHSSIIEKMGLSFLLGLGLETVFLLLFDLAHIPITYLTMVGTSTLLALFLIYFKMNSLAEDFKALKNYRIRIGQINFTWLLFFSILLYIVYAISKKGLYWPIMENDSVVGYDYMAKLIAAEGKINNSVFEGMQGTLSINRFLYPPLVSGSFAMAYISGEELSKAITLIFYVSLLVTFYGLVKKYTTHTSAMLFTCFMAVTPEMYSHAALGLTNLPNAAYVSLAIISLFVYTDRKDKEYFWLSAILMSFSLYSRSDSVVFAFAALAWLALEAWRQKDLKPILMYGVISLSLFVAWNVYVKLIIKANAGDFFIKEFFWDPEKLGNVLDKAYSFIVSDTQLYGLTFWAFFLMLAVNYKNLRSDKPSLLVVTLLAWVLYTALYYQMDYVLASLELYMNASYKRGMFCFVPLAWYYVATNKSSIWLFTKIDGILYR
jgi:hypothetical protein